MRKGIVLSYFTCDVHLGILCRFHLDGAGLVCDGFGNLSRKVCKHRVMCKPPDLRSWKIKTITSSINLEPNRFGGGWVQCGTEREREAC